jgi:4-alpha-glucanotransferase
LFDALDQAFDDLPIIAEDLGVITPEVETLRDDNSFPGMKVLQFAFAGDAADPYLPHNYSANSVVYSGTHDNDTTLGWYQQVSAEEKDFIRRYIGSDASDITWDFIRLAFGSVAVMAVVPLQDIMRLGKEARMNTPGKERGNWSWRFSSEQLEPWMEVRLKDLAICYGRVGTGKRKDTAYRQSSLLQGDDAVL